MEKNTVENKAKFFAQYWGQKVVFHPVLFDPITLIEIIKDEDEGFENDISRSHLELKPLSQITDEDATEIAGIINETVTGATTGEKVNYLVDQIKSDPEVLGYATSRTVDFCRSKGYAVDWNGISVEQQIEFGWLKLKNHKSQY